MIMEVTESEKNLLHKVRDKDNFIYEGDFEKDLGEVVEQSIKEMNLKDISPQQYLNIMSELQKNRSLSQDTRESNHRLLESIVIILREIRVSMGTIKRNFVKYIALAFILGAITGTIFGIGYPHWKPYASDVWEFGKRYVTGKVKDEVGGL